MRFAVMLVAALAWGQTSVPEDRRAFTYAVYSAALADLRPSHVDSNKKYLIEELSAVERRQDARQCLKAPPAYQTEFRQLLADWDRRGKEQHRFERAFTLAKPYVLLTREQAQEFRELRANPARSTDEAELFRGAQDLIALGKVYFDDSRKLAAVYISSWCGNLCAVGSWRIFTRNVGGGWDEQRWAICMVIAALR